jgi:hypothetical protein
MGMTTAKQMTDAQIHTANFASAVRIVHGQSKGLDVKGEKLVEAMGIKGRGFPRTDMKLFSRNLRAAARAGLIKLVDDGDCLWVVCA